MIKVRNLVGGYGGAKILNGINLQVEQGEILAIMGQSGCGKTTFLRHLMGLEKPISGSIRIHNLEMASMDEGQYRHFCRSVGVLFQNGALFNSMTIGDNVAFPLREHTHLAEPVIRIMVKMILDQVELRDVQHLMPSELSGGMSRRAALARALIMGPELIILDEPTTGLDPIIAAEIDELILHIREVYGATMVIVAHDILSCMHVADKIAIFHKGKVLEEGTAEEIKNSQHPFVKRFFNREAEKKQDKVSLFAG